jgi:hypothetical protein
MAEADEGSNKLTYPLRLLRCIEPLMALSGELLRRRHSVAIGAIVLQKSFCTGDQNFSGL